MAVRAIGAVSLSCNPAVGPRTRRCRSLPHPLGSDTRGITDPAPLRVPLPHERSTPAPAGLVRLSLRDRWRLAPISRLTNGLTANGERTAHAPKHFFLR